MAGTIEREAVTSAAASWMQPGPRFLLVCSGLAFTRLLFGDSFAIMWADDGRMMQVALTEGPVATITHGYQGYLNVVPMSVVAILEPLPLAWMTPAFIAVWAVAVGLGAWFIAAISSDLLESPTSRTMLGLSVALLPVAAIESIGTIANIHWYLLAAATFAVTCTPASDGQRRASTVFVTLAALSSPVALTLGPFLWRRRGDMRPAIVGWSIGVVAQVVTALTVWGSRTGEPTEGKWSDLDGVLGSLLAMASNGALTDARLGVQVSALAIAAALVIAVRHRTDPEPASRFVTLAAIVLLQWWFTYTGGGQRATAPRYAVVAAIVFTALLLATTERSRNHQRVVIVVLCACWIGSFAPSAYRSTGPSWHDQLDSNRGCNGAVEIALAPRDWGVMSVPCSRL